MSTTQTLVQVIKAELKAAGITYAVLARELGLAESSVKRMFSRGEMPLARIDAICQLLRTDFAELSRQVAAAHPPRHELTLAQERAVVADPKLLLMAVCCQSQWTLAQVVASYRVSEAEGIALLARLDRLGIIELRPHNRYRLKLAKAFRWRAQGPVMAYFRAQVLPDFYSGGFDGEGELLTLVHGQLGHAQAALMAERLQRLAQDFAQQHLADQRLPDGQRRPVTLLIGQRSWVFGAFQALKR